MGVPPLLGQCIPVLVEGFCALFKGTQFPYWNNIFRKRLAQNK
jgi:hypothetical protein